LKPSSWSRDSQHRRRKEKVREYRSLRGSHDTRAEVFQLALPANVNWIDPGKPQASGGGYTAASPEAAARAFFEAFGREDWAVVAKFWPLPLDDRFKQFLGGMEVVNLGQSFASAAGPAKFVPYEIRMKNGAIRKHNLALKQYQGGGWFVDGGL
jgi:hypothetical protein